MLFNSWSFVLFFALVLPSYYALSHRWQNRFLLAASYFFYGMWDWRFLGLLGISTLVDYVAALGMEGNPNERRRRAWLYLSLVTNLGILGYFKYAGFLVDSAADFLEMLGFQANLPSLHIILPVGISFYTFQTLGYSIDVYRGKQRATRDLLSFALYVSFFAQLVAGPIERAQRLLPQLEARRTVRADHFSSGFQLLLWGYVKKVAIADSLVPYQVEAFTAHAPPEHTSLLWLSMYASALQAYGDFSGYSDIARGVGRLLGIQIVENFRQPFFAPNVTEFWRRWHVSLSQWLRDYVYIPLGGNRQGEVRQLWNLFLTMVIGGLWHGAAWTFAVWGAVNGLLLAVHKLMTRGRKVRYDERPRGLAEWVSFVPRVVVTFHCFAVTLVILRAPNIGYAWDFLLGMFRPGAGGPLPTAYEGLLPTLAFYWLLTFAIDVGCWAGRWETPCPPQLRWWQRGLAIATGLLVLGLIREGNVEEFFYFQF